MRYLETYKKYTENLDISDTDTEDMKKSKEGLNNISNQIKEYNEKKPKLDNLYKIDRNLDLTKEVDKIMGDSDNIFLKLYNTICASKNKVDRAQKRYADKTIEMGKLKDLYTTTEPKDRSGLDKRSAEVKVQLSEIKKEIEDLKKKIPEMEKELKEKLLNTESEIKSWGSNLTTK